MNSRFLNPGEKRKLIAFLNERFGVDRVDMMFIETGKEKIRGFSGTLNREELIKLGMFARVELVGLYFARNDRVGGMRLSFDALHFLKDKVKDNIIEISESEFKRWMHGEQIETKMDEGVYAIKYKGDFVGCGYSNGARLFNYVPKERYLKFD